MVTFPYALVSSSDGNECSSNPCMNSGTCTDMIADYKCTCKDGYTGKNCETGRYNIFCIEQLPKSINEQKSKLMFEHLSPSHVAIMLTYHHAKFTIFDADKPLLLFCSDKFFL